jgi:DNA-binding transcriptional LysR family regulator
VIDLKLLQHALALARHRNFARAAEALDLSQPALSRSIAGFEATLGVRLFNRTRQGVEPTAFGERLLARGGALLTDAAELERELKLMQGLDVGVLRVGAGPYAAAMCVGPAIGRLASKHPRLRIELVSGDWRMVVDEVLGSRLDVAIVELSFSEDDPRLATEALPQHDALFYCRAGHPLLARAANTVEQVFAYPFVCPKLPPRAGRAFHRFAKTGAIDPDTGDYLPPIKVDTVALAKIVVQTSDAIGLAPLGLLADEVRAGSIATLPFREPWLHTRYGIVRLKDRDLAPAAHAFVAEAKAVEAALVGTERRIGSRPLAATAPSTRSRTRARR